jgi:hypothetical protein
MRSLGALPTPLLALLASFSISPALADHDDPSVKIEVTTPVGCTRPTRSGDKISVHYKGTLESTGAEFDQSYKRGKPFTFTLGAHQVIRGWEEGLLDMCPGEGRRLTIPSDLAYGDHGIPPTIPGGATLVFETELVDIVGVKQESLTFATTATEADFSIATAPPTPPTEDEKVEEEDALPELHGTPLSDETAEEKQKGQCHLLGPFALIVQGSLGIVAILSLVVKRWRETPKRPWLIWFFDVSKQVVGSVLVHILNLLMSNLGAGELVNAAQQAADKSGKSGNGGQKKPNPCSFYLLNLGIDVSITKLGVWFCKILTLTICRQLWAYQSSTSSSRSCTSPSYTHL